MIFCNESTYEPSYICAITTQVCNGGEKGRHLLPRLVQKMAHCKRPCESSWRAKVTIKKKGVPVIMPISGVLIPVQSTWCVCMFLPVAPRGIIASRNVALVLVTVAVLPPRHCGLSFRGVTHRGPSMVTPHVRVFVAVGSAGRFRSPF